MTGADQLQLKYPTQYHLQAVKSRQHPSAEEASFAMDEDNLISETEYVDMRQLSYVSDLNQLGHQGILPLKIPQSEPIFQHPPVAMHPYQVESQSMHTSSIPIGIKSSLPYSHSMIQDGSSHGWSAPDSPGQINPGWSSTPNQPYLMDHASFSASSYEDDPRTQANLQQAMERRRRRRESHNAVERRRRDHINECIQKIGFLLPDDSPDVQYNKSNKGSILQSSIEFIKTLEAQIAFYQSRVGELEAELQLSGYHS